jgi:hypothetical protein
MKLHDITSLKRTEAQSNLYDLSEPTFNFTSTQYFERTILPEEEMRIDLVSYNLYGSVDYADILLRVNDIVNPLNIKLGDVIIYPDAASLLLFRVTPPTPSDERAALLNSSRANIRDPRRTQFLENNIRTAPTVLQVPQSPIQINNDNIVITPL